MKIRKFANPVLIPYILLSLSVFACRNSKGKSVNLEKNKREYAINKLDESGEKVALLSILAKVSLDTLANILYDYYYESWELHSIKGVDSVINTVSVKYSLPKKRVAGLVYSFTYNMSYDDYLKRIDEEVYESNIGEDVIDTY